MARCPLCFSTPFLFWQANLLNEGTIGILASPLLAFSSFLGHDQLTCQPNKHLVVPAFPVLTVFCFARDWQDQMPNKQSIEPSVLALLCCFFCHANPNDMLEKWMTRHPLCFSAPFLFWHLPTVSLTASTWQLHITNLQSVGSWRLSIASAFEGITSLLEPIDSLLGDNLLTVSLTASTQQLHTPNPQSVGSWGLSIALALKGISSLQKDLNCCYWPFCQGLT